ncbi:MAG: tetratricopeptide repeat protein [Blastocatellia bacterium]
MAIKQNILRIENKLPNNPSFIIQNHSQDKINFVSSILTNCHKKKCTGTLTLKSSGIIKSIHFSSGEIIFATSNLPKEQFSEFLVSSRIISYQQLEKANEFVPRYQLHLGQVLVRLGYLDEDKLKNLTTKLVSNIVWSTLIWQSPEVIFQEHQQLNDRLKISTPTLQLLYEGILQIENPSFLKQMLGNLDSQLYLNDTPSKIYQLLNLENEEAFILSCLDSKPYTTKALIEMGSISEVNVLRIICALLQTGFLRSLSFDKKDFVPKSSRFLDTGSIMKLCQEIDLKVKDINSGVSVYKLFEVDDNADIKQLKDSYERLIRKFHPSQQVQFADYQLDFRSELEYIFQKLTDSINTFSNYENKNSNKNNNFVEDKSNEKVIYFKQNPNNNCSSINNSEEPHLAIRQLCYEIETKYNATKDGATFYQILGVERDSSKQIIDDAFNHLSKQFSADRQAELSKYGLDLKVQLQHITLHLNTAFRTLSDPIKKQEYDNQIGMNFISKTNKVPTSKPVQLPIKATVYKQVTSPISPIPLPIQAKVVSTNDSNIENTPLRSTNKDIKGFSTEENSLSDNGSSKCTVEKSSIKDNKIPTASMFYLQSMQLYAREDYEKTVKALQKALKLSPNNAEYWAELGNVYSRIPNSSIVVIESAYKEAMRCNPQDADYPTQLGLVYQKFGDYLKAKEWFEKALEINPKQITAKQSLEELQKSNVKERKSTLNSFLEKLGFSKQ